MKLYPQTGNFKLDGGHVWRGAQTIWNKIQLMPTTSLTLQHVVY
jgi:hypothetical protein